jgi:hypothetical protein
MGASSSLCGSCWFLFLGALPWEHDKRFYAALLLGEQNSAMSEVYWLMRHHATQQEGTKACVCTCAHTPSGSNDGGLHVGG